MTNPVHAQALSNSLGERTRQDTTKEVLRGASTGALSGAAISAMGSYATGKKLSPAATAALSAGGAVLGGIQGRAAAQERDQGRNSSMLLDSLKFDRQQNAMAERAEARKKTAVMEAFADELTKSAGILGAVGRGAMNLGMRAAKAVGHQGAAAGAMGAGLRTAGSAAALQRNVGAGVLGAGALATGVGVGMAANRR